MGLPLLAFTNLAATSTTTGSTEVAGYPASNIKEAQRPFKPWRTTATTQQTVVIDLGSSQNWNAVFLNRTNWTTGSIQAHTSDSWGAPAYSQAITVAQHPDTGRYVHLHLPAATRTERYLRIVIDSQTPVVEGVDTAPAAYFRLGGVFVGLATAAPTGFRIPLPWEEVDPVEELRPEHGGWRQQLQRGEPIWRIDIERVVEISATTPAVADQLASWQTLDRQIQKVKTFLLGLNDGVASHAGMMSRDRGAQWLRLGRLVEGRASLEEVVR